MLPNPALGWPGATSAGNFAYHPTALGHEVMAQMIAAVLDGTS